MKQKFNEIDTIWIFVTFILSVCWAIMGDEISSDPYKLGVFRGFIWPNIIYFICKRLNH